MVRAILEGRKAQTRRIMNNQPAGAALGPVYIRERDGGFQWYGIAGESSVFKCPYGKPGDRLWVRETWRTGWSYGGDYPTVQYRATETAHVGSKEYPVLDVLRGEFGIPDPAPHSIVPGGKWKPSIHMPRWASRITLEVVSVRVERLQDITRSDIRAEGILVPAEFASDDKFRCYLLDQWIKLWESINGPGSWEANPWVWVVEFKRITP